MELFVKSTILFDSEYIFDYMFEAAIKALDYWSFFICNAFFQLSLTVA